MRLFGRCAHLFSADARTSLHSLAVRHTYRTSRVPQDVRKVREMDAQLRTLAELIERLPEGSGALVIAGEVGIGKSSLLRAAVRLGRVAGAEILETTGAECEARLPHAGLHQLLRPLVGPAEALQGHAQAVPALDGGHRSTEATPTTP